MRRVILQVGVIAVGVVLYLNLSLLLLELVGRVSGTPDWRYSRMVAQMKADGSTDRQIEGYFQTPSGQFLLREMSVFHWYVLVPLTCVVVGFVLGLVDPRHGIVMAPAAVLAARILRLFLSSRSPMPEFPSSANSLVVGLLVATAAAAVGRMLRARYGGAGSQVKRVRS